MVFYVDTSALVKLVVHEAETPALRSWISAGSPTLVTSDPARTELLRAVRRAAPDRAVQARGVLDSLTMLSLTTATFETAAQLDPVIQGSLGAIHLAAALELGDDLSGLLSYDDRLAEAAREHGIAVHAPA